MKVDSRRATQIKKINKYDDIKEKKISSKANGYCVNNHLGTPLEIMSDNGAIHESFVTPTITTAAIPNNLR